MKLEGRVEDKINLLEYSINCKFELTKMQKRTIRELLEEQKDIINRIRSIYQSLCFSAPENYYIFIEQLGEVLKGSDKE